MKYHADYPLAEHTTWKAGGNADFAVFPESVEQVQEACRWALQKSVPMTVLSGGSNVLVSDKGIEGLVIMLQKFSGVSKVEYKQPLFTAVCLAGTPKADLLKAFVRHRLSPAIFLAGLPGDIGGGVVMNAGVGHDVAPREFHEIVSWVEYIDLRDPGLSIRRKQKNEIRWDYRKTTGWQPGIITTVGVRWEEIPDENVLKRLQEGNKRRMATQPLQQPSCGSVFKNPEGNKSGRLIEECGLKGFKIGGAQVSEKHANFIVNTGKATSADIEAVKNHVQQTVLKEKNIQLETEFVFLGRR